MPLFVFLSEHQYYCGTVYTTVSKLFLELQQNWARDNTAVTTWPYFQTIKIVDYCNMSIFSLWLLCDSESLAHVLIVLAAGCNESAESYFSSETFGKKFKIKNLNINVKRPCNNLNSTQLNSLRIAPNGQG